MAGERLWTEQEYEAAVEAYVRMLAHQRTGRKFVKADIVAGVSEQIGRTPSSVMRRFGNISHVCKTLGAAWVRGYAPLSGVTRDKQELIAVLLLRAMSRRPAPKRRKLRAAA